MTPIVLSIIRKTPESGSGISLGAGLALTALLIFWGHGWLTGIPLH
ncbi:hypothetical protein KAM367_28890 [Aeromonas caviae]|nr:hypothetical protein KAM367_28890 [Aeromonas caviae]